VRDAYVSFFERACRRLWVIDAPLKGPDLGDAGRKSDSRKFTGSWKRIRGGPASQSRWFVSLEVRVITAKKETLQTLGIPKNRAWNALALYFKEFDKPVNRASKSPVN
jgi:hypothetical protein